MSAPAFAQTPAPPYYAVIFTSQRTEGDQGYGDMAERMVELAHEQSGFLGVESARGAGGFGITVSYWESTQAILENDVLPSINRSFLKQFDGRLIKHYNGDELKTAEVILDKVARAKPVGKRLDGSKLPAGHQRVLQMLEYGNFILRGPDFRWSFALNLLRQWWRAERGMK